MFSLFGIKLVCHNGKPLQCSPVVEPEPEPAVERVSHHPLSQAGDRVEQADLAADGALAGNRNNGVRDSPIGLENGQFTCFPSPSPPTNLKASPPPTADRRMGARRNRSRMPPDLYVQKKKKFVVFTRSCLGIFAHPCPQPFFYLFSSSFAKKACACLSPIPLAALRWVSVSLLHHPPFPLSPLTAPSSGGANPRPKAALGKGQPFIPPPLFFPFSLEHAGNGREQNYAAPHFLG